MRSWPAPLPPMRKRFASWLVGPYRHCHRADAAHFRGQHVARLDRRHAFRRAGEDDVARIKRIELGGILDHRRYGEKELARRRALAYFAVHLERHFDIVWIAEFVRCDEPRAEHAVAVDRLARARRLGAAQGHVEADGIASDDLQRTLARYAARLAADDDGELELRIVAPIEEAQRHAFGGPDERCIRLDEH